MVHLPCDRMSSYRDFYQVDITLEHRRPTISMPMYKASKIIGRHRLAGQRSTYPEKPSSMRVYNCALSRTPSFPPAVLSMLSHMGYRKTYKVRHAQFLPPVSSLKLTTTSMSVL